MNNIKNKPETFFREIRRVEIYPAEALPYIANWAGFPPDAAEMLYQFTVNPGDYDRKIPTKTNNGNYFFEVDINFPLLDMSAELRAELYEKLNRTGFCIVLVSNTEKMILGNDREPLTVEIIDGMKDDASGNDQFNISITGQTIVQPKAI